LAVSLSADTNQKQDTSKASLFPAKTKSGNDTLGTEDELKPNPRPSSGATALASPSKKPMVAVVDKNASASDTPHAFSVKDLPASPSSVEDLVRQEGSHRDTAEDAKEDGKGTTQEGKGDKEGKEAEADAKLPSGSLSAMFASPKKGGGGSPAPVLQQSRKASTYREWLMNQEVLELEAEGGATGEGKADADGRPAAAKAAPLPSIPESLGIVNAAKFLREHEEDIMKLFHTVSEADKLNAQPLNEGVPLADFAEALEVFGRDNGWGPKLGALLPRGHLTRLRMVDSGESGAIVGRVSAVLLISWSEYEQAVELLAQDERRLLHPAVPGRMVTVNPNATSTEDNKPAAPYVLLRQYSASPLTQQQAESEGAPKVVHSFVVRVHVRDGATQTDATLQPKVSPAKSYSLHTQASLRKSDSVRVKNAFGKSISQQDADLDKPAPHPKSPNRSATLQRGMTTMAVIMEDPTRQPFDHGGEGNIPMLAPLSTQYLESPTGYIPIAYIQAPAPGMPHSVAPAFAGSPPHRAQSMSVGKALHTARVGLPPPDSAVLSPVSRDEFPDNLLANRTSDPGAASQRVFAQDRLSFLGSPSRSHSITQNNLLTPSNAPGANWKKRRIPSPSRSIQMVSSPGGAVSSKPGNSSGRPSEDSRSTQLQRSKTGGGYASLHKKDEPALQQEEAPLPIFDGHGQPANSSTQVLNRNEVDPRRQSKPAQRHQFPDANSSVDYDEDLRDAESRRSVFRVQPLGTGIVQPAFSSVRSSHIIEPLGLTATRDTDSSGMRIAEASQPSSSASLDTNEIAAGRDFDTESMRYAPGSADVQDGPLDGSVRPGVTWLPTASAGQSLSSVLPRFSRSLHAIFFHFTSDQTSKEFETPPSMVKQDFLRLCKIVGLSGPMLSPQQITDIYKSVTNSYSAHALDEAAFIEALARAAITMLSTSELGDAFPEPGDKVDAVFSAVGLNDMSSLSRRLRYDNFGYGQLAGLGGRSVQTRKSLQEDDLIGLFQLQSMDGSSEEIGFVPQSQGTIDSMTRMGDISGHPSQHQVVYGHDVSDRGHHDALDPGNRSGQHRVYPSAVVSSPSLQRGLSQGPRSLPPLASL
jgi:hypothetical protein